MMWASSNASSQASRSLLLCLCSEVLVLVPDPSVFFLCEIKRRRAKFLFCGCTVRSSSRSADSWSSINGSTMRKLKFLAVACISSCMLESSVWNYYLRRWRTVFRAILGSQGQL